MYGGILLIVIFNIVLLWAIGRLVLEKLGS